MLEFKNVDVSISKVPILNDISVSFERGKITSIIGPNGCGKTTLLQTINGVSQVTNGTVLLDGEKFFDIPLKERAKRISFMAQFRGSAPNISVKGLVEHGRFPYMGFSRKMSTDDIEAVEKALEYTDIKDYRKKLVSELSGGLQQKAYLAMQLAQNSDYMVMDEPMNHLDFPSQRDIYRLIEGLGKAGKTIILVSHDLNHALKISDSLVVMKDRQIVSEGTPDEILESGVIKDVFECDVNVAEIDGDKQYLFK